MFFIKAPRSSVLPPAPAQKSTTISPRRGRGAGRGAGCLRPGLRCCRRKEGVWPAPACRQGGRPRAKAPGNGGDAVASQALEYRRPAGLEIVDPEVQRRRLVHPRRGQGFAFRRTGATRAPYSQSGRSQRTAGGRSASLTAWRRPASRFHHRLEDGFSWRRLQPKAKARAASTSWRGVGRSPQRASRLRLRRSTANTVSATKPGRRDRVRVCSRKPARDHGVGRVVETQNLSPRTFSAWANRAG